jgi:hypothetical protein
VCLCRAFGGAAWSYDESVSLFRGIDGDHGLRPEPVERLGGPQEIRADARAWHLATGSLACPLCDAPVVLTAPVQGPADPLACAYCDHAGRVRDFLSLAQPSRPTRVHVRIRVPLSAAARA